MQLVSLLVLIVHGMHVATVASAEFGFTALTNDSACVNYRGDTSTLWANLSKVTPQSAEYLCKAYMPGSITGFIRQDCYTAGGAGFYRDRLNDRVN